MTSLLVTGYKSFELGIFKDKDPKVSVSWMMVWIG